MVKIPIACLLFQAFFITSSAIALPGNKVKALYKEGMLFKKSGQLSAAQQCFREVLEQEPAHPEALEAMAGVFFEEEAYEDALNYAEQARLAGVDQMNCLKGLCYYKQGQINKAINALLTAQKEAPSDAGISYTLAGIYFNIKDFDAAVGSFEQARIKGYPMDADFCLNLGAAYLHIKQPDKGIRYLELCLAQRTGEVRALQTLGHAYYANGNYTKAIVYWNQLLLLQPDNGFARFMLGKSYIGNGEISKGEELCDKATAS
jgi:tetratricopeptide (TPR) repeat protein